MKTLNDKPLTYEEAAVVVANYADSYNSEAEEPMTSQAWHTATNNVDTVEAVEINHDAWDCGEDEELLFNVLISE